MKNIQKSIDSFLKPWRKKSGYLGAVLTGSYATGTQTEFSDIDIQIIYDNSTDWRERGNKIIDGKIFEYFANPISQFHKYMESELRSNRKTTARMFVTGIIIEDNSGKVSDLQDHAQKVFKVPFAKPNKLDTEIAKYIIWDCLDGLTDLKKQKSPDFTILYGITITKILETYTKFMRMESPSTSKLWRYLSEPKFRESYKMIELPDKDFAKLLRTAIQKPSLSSIKKLGTYTQLQLGGFTIDGWKILSPAEK